MHQIFSSISTQKTQIEDISLNILWLAELIVEINLHTLEWFFLQSYQGTNLQVFNVIGGLLIDIYFIYL